jgi:hypothetical protein
VIPDIESKGATVEQASPPIVVILSFLERRCEYAEQSDGHLHREMTLLLTFSLTITLVAGGLAAAGAAFACIVIAVQEHRQDSLISALPSLLALISVGGSAVATAVTRRRRVRHGSATRP